MLPGENAPPMHPRCRCSTAAYEDSAGYEKWLDETNRKMHARDVKTSHKPVASGGRSSIMKINRNGLTKISSDRVEVENPMSVERYNRMKKGLNKQGISVVSAISGDDLKYMQWMQAEAIAQSSNQIMHIGEIPSASAFFEEIIHVTQFRKYGDVVAGDYLERAAREVAANRKLLANQRAYGFDSVDIADIERNLSIWEEDFLQRAGVSYDEGTFNRDV